MPVNPDFRDLFAVLNGAGARYLLVGGYAVSFHAQPRYTKDLDVWVESTAENAKRVYEALDKFGAPLSELTVEDLTTPDTIFQMGRPPNRIDVLTGIDGVTFEEAWPSRVTTTYGDQTLDVIGREQLRKNKLATGRPQDLLDAALLESSEER